MKVSTVLLSDKGNIIEVTGHPETVIGMSPNEIVGRHADDVFYFKESSEENTFSLLSELIGKKTNLSSRVNQLDLDTAVIEEPEFSPGSVKLVLSAMSEEEMLIDKRNKLLAMFSHDIRNPLNSVLGFLQLLEMGTYGSMDKQCMNSLKIAEKNTRRVLSMAENILSLESMKTGSLNLQVNNICLAEIVNRAVNIATPRAERKSIEISSWTPPEAKIAGDGEKLLQVLINLLDNAIKFSPARTQVKIKCEDLGNHFVLSVVDHGVGVPDEFHDLIFEPFYQLDSDCKTEGFGLGLALCKTIAESHNGEIGIISMGALKPGSEFWIRIPKTQNQLEQTAKRSCRQQKLERFGVSG